ncbi:MAG: excinuclease ABC subunit UvrC [Mycoplasmatales bacterium]
MKEIQNQVPNLPGCYLYYNQDQDVIYVGKAKDLKKRMSSYFNRATDLKTTKLVQEIATFEYYVTTSEHEALILENNLIKQYNPHYNILLKDDKSYPYLLVTKEAHPRLIRVRETTKKGIYFGPYPSAKFVNDVLHELHKITQLRKCVKLPKETCIYYHLGQCYAPCIKEVASETYVNEVKDYLKNDMRKLKVYLKNAMTAAASEFNFEQASHFRDIVQSIEEYEATQTMELPTGKNFNVIEYENINDWLIITIISIVNGKVHNINNAIISLVDPLEDICSYLYSFFKSTNYDFDEFVTSDPELKLTINNLFLKTAIPVHLTTYKQLIEIAKVNGQEYYRNHVEKITKQYFQKQNEGYEALKQIAKSKLKRIEIYDISHHGGDAQVAAMVVYENGKKNPNQYRKFKIKTAKANDEYGSLAEVLERRFTNNDLELPDLVILDGGKGQMTIATDVLKKLGLFDSLMVIGLVKDDKHTTRAIVNKAGAERKLVRNTPLYRFLYQMQEEVHRFAIAFHRSVKTNSLFLSKLDQVKGLGPKRKQILIENFGYLEKMLEASDSELIKLKLPQAVIVELRKLKKDWELEMFYEFITKIGYNKSETYRQRWGFMVK